MHRSFYYKHNIFDCIIENAVVYDAQNLSSHNIVYFCIGVSNFKHMIDINCNLHPAPNCNWSKAKVEHIEKYQLALNNKLSYFDANTQAINCGNWHCQCVEHRDHINFLCSTLKSSRSENHTPRFHLFNRSIRPYIL